MLGAFNPHRLVGTLVGLEPIFETARLAFRLMEESDEADLERLDSDPEVRAFFPGGVSIRPTSRQRIADNRASYASHRLCDFCVVDKTSGAFMGRAGLHQMDDGEVEAGYLFLKPHWGRGYATETLRGLLEWARSLGGESVPRRRLIAFAPVGHHASLRVMVKAGMKRFKTGTAHGVECAFYEAPLSP